MYRNVFYFQHINEIGGVETFFYELVKKYRLWDITIVYSSGSQQQINRLKQYARIEKLNKSKQIECEKVFFNYALAIDYFKAKEYYQILHADYKQQGLEPSLDPRLTGYIAVSQTVATSFNELTGIEPMVCFNPLTIEDEDTNPVLNIISATRLTKEKGKWRMEALAKSMREAGILFNWDIYTNDTISINVPGVYYKKPNLNIRPFIAKADLLVQLSDSEGWCYTVNEALSLGTKVLATPCPSLKEMGGKDIIYLAFDLSNMQEVLKELSQLGKRKDKSTFEPVKDRWDEILAPGKSTYYIEEERVKTVVVKNYFDIMLDTKLFVGDIITMPKTRAEYLVGKGLVLILQHQF